MWRWMSCALRELNMRVLRDETHHIECIGNAPIERVVLLQIPVPENEDEVTLVPPQVQHLQLGVVLN